VPYLCVSGLAKRRYIKCPYDAFTFAFVIQYNAAMLRVMPLPPVHWTVGNQSVIRKKISLSLFRRHHRLGALKYGMLMNEKCFLDAKQEDGSRILATAWRAFHFIRSTDEVYE